MALSIHDLLRLSTVKINTEVGSRGTGFFVAPGIILTCAHVLKEPLGSKINLLCSDLKTTLEAGIVEIFPDGVDLAILVCNSPNSSDYCVYLDDDIESRDPCYTYGYSFHEEGNENGDPVTLECEGKIGTPISGLKLKCGQVLPGLSGSPLLNNRTSKVCGVVRDTRDERFDLGAEAVPINFLLERFTRLIDLQQEFHNTDLKWRNLLVHDTNPFDSDWLYLDESAKKKLNYLKTIWFLIKVLGKWIILGHQAPRAFPFKTIQVLFQHTLKGDLGQEIKRQREKLSSDLALKLDLEGTYQARLINQLDSQAWVISSLIENLIDNKQDLASLSRLSWANDILYEQRGLLQELKHKEGNLYPKLEDFKKKYKIFDYQRDSRYVDADKVIGGLIAKYSTNKSLLIDSLDLSVSSWFTLQELEPNYSLFYIDSLLKIFDFFPRIDYMNALETKVSLDEILDDLERNILANPRLKILRKFKVLLQGTVGELVVGGPIRARKTSNVYHYNRACHNYPERVNPSEMRDVQCFSTVEDAKKAGYVRACIICGGDQTD